MRVTLYIDSDVFAGTERHIVELAGALKEQSFLVSIACPSASPLNRFAREMGLEIIRIEKQGLFDFTAVREFRRLLATGRLDLIHAHNGRTALAAAAARLLAGRGSVVATQHFIDPAHAGRVGLAACVSRVAHRWVQHQVDEYIAVSRAAERAMIERESRLAGKVAVIPNGISAPDPATLEPATEIRDSLGVPRDALLIVCAARLAPEKDVATLVEAMGPVVAQVPQARCVIVGDGPERRAIEEQIRKAPWGGQIRLPGFRKDAISIIRAADVFVLPSRAEPFGLVLLEAMAFAKPVVSTAAGGPLEIVKTGETGFLVPPGDAAALADAIIKLLRNPELRRSAGSKGQFRFQRHFTAPAMAAATLDVYERASLRDSMTAISRMEENQCESY